MLNPKYILNPKVKSHNYIPEMWIANSVVVDGEFQLEYVYSVNILANDKCGTYVHKLCTTASCDTSVTYVAEFIINE